MKAKVTEDGVVVPKELLDGADEVDIHIDETLFNEAWDYFKKHEDESYSLTDCISFIILERLPIQMSLTFDKHFVQAGFNKLP